jgi:hypothetical protein
MAVDSSLPVDGAAQLELLGDGGRPEFEAARELLGRELVAGPEGVHAEGDRARGAGCIVLAGCR